MCGIFAYISRVNNTGVTHITSIIKRDFHKGRSRGTESSSFI